MPRSHAEVWQTETGHAGSAACKNKTLKAVLRKSRRASAASNITDSRSGAAVLKCSQFKIQTSLPVLFPRMPRSLNIRWSSHPTKVCSRSVHSCREDRNHAAVLKVFLNARHNRYKFPSRDQSLRAQFQSFAEMGRTNPSHPKV